MKFKYLQAPASTAFLSPAAYSLSQLIQSVQSYSFPSICLIEITFDLLDLSTIFFQ